MIDRDDERWKQMTGGYGTPYDPRPLLHRLETGNDAREIWKTVWDELYHQGDIGEASLAAVPMLVETHMKRELSSWDIYAFVAMVESARGERNNPDAPGWFARDYFHAIRMLAERGGKELLRTNSAESARAILSIMAIERGLRTHGRFLMTYSEDELLDIESSH